MALALHGRSCNFREFAQDLSRNRFSINDDWSGGQPFPKIMKHHDWSTQCASRLGMPSPGLTFCPRMRAKGYCRLLRPEFRCVRAWSSASLVINVASEMGFLWMSHDFYRFLPSWSWFIALNACFLIPGPDPIQRGDLEHIPWCPFLHDPRSHLSWGKHNTGNLWLGTCFVNFAWHMSLRWDSYDGSGLTISPLDVPQA